MYHKGEKHGSHIWNPFLLESVSGFAGNQQRQRRRRLRPHIDSRQFMCCAGYVACPSISSGAQYLPFTTAKPFHFVFPPSNHNRIPNSSEQQQQQQEKTRSNIIPPWFHARIIYRVCYLPFNFNHFFFIGWSINRALYERVKSERLWGISGRCTVQHQ